jgi:hypothetical protein
MEVPAVSNVQDVKPMPAPRTSATAPSPADQMAATVKSTMTREEQSAAMPMPGQANDHSTLKPKPAASAPR